MATPTTHYQVLGVAPAATAETIKAAYRKLIRKHHPDLVGPTGVEMTGKINHAYSVLSDAGARRTYDRELADAKRASSPPPRQSRPQTPPRAQPENPYAKSHRREAPPRAAQDQKSRQDFGYIPPQAPPSQAAHGEKPWHDFSYMPGRTADDEDAPDAMPERPPIFRQWSTPKFITVLLLTPLGLFIVFAGWQSLLLYNASVPGGAGIVLAQWAAVPAALSALFARRPKVWVWVLLGYAGVLQPLASLDWFPVKILAMGQESNLGQLGMLAIALGFVLYRVAGRELVIRFRCRPRKS